MSGSTQFLNFALELNLKRTLKMLRVLLYRLLDIFVKSLTLRTLLQRSKTSSCWRLLTISATILIKLIYVNLQSKPSYIVFLMSNRISQLNKKEISLCKRSLKPLNKKTVKSERTHSNAQLILEVKNMSTFNTTSSLLLSLQLIVPFLTKTKLELKDLNSGLLYAKKNSIVRTRVSLSKDILLVARTTCLTFFYSV